MTKEEIRMNKQELSVFNQHPTEQVFPKMIVPTPIAPKLKIMDPSPKRSINENFEKNYTKAKLSLAAENQETPVKVDWLRANSLTN